MNRGPSSGAARLGIGIPEAANSLIQPALPSPCWVVHTGWEVSGVSTAKCDLCHQQRCGVIQKCCECKLSVCKPCSLSGRLETDARHVLDPGAVSWAVPPVKRRTRRLRPSRRNGAEKQHPPGQNTWRLESNKQSQPQQADSNIASSSRVQPRAGLSPVEPRLSVAPASPYHQLPGPAYPETYYAHNRGPGPSASIWQSDDDPSNTRAQEAAPSAPPPDQQWPSTRQIELLSARLASAAQSMLILQPHLALGHHLRAEIEHVWTFMPNLLREGEQVPVQEVFGLVLAAADAAVQGLGLPVENEARQWLRETQGRLEEGFEEQDMDGSL